MRVRVKLGCLQNTTRIPGSASSVLHEYACSPVNVELPQEGTSHVAAECRACGQQVGLSAYSPERVQTEIAVAALVIAALAGGIGYALMSTSAGNQIAAWSAYGVGAVALLAAAALSLLGAEALPLLSLSVRLGAGAGGHRILEVDRIADKAAVPAGPPT